jgi:hypothetical protein
MILSRIIFQWLTKSVFANAAQTCSDAIIGIAVESSDSPFFEHYHQLVIPASVLIKIPEEGVRLVTTPVDSGSYNEDQLDQLVKQTRLNKEKLQTHSHEVFIDKASLERIAQGEKNVEIRVISASGNYVHNFIVNSSPAILAKIKWSKK